MFLIFDINSKLAYSIISETPVVVFFSQRVQFCFTSDLPALAGSHHFSGFSDPLQELPDILMDFLFPQHNFFREVQ